MQSLVRRITPQLAAAPVRVALLLPSGQRVGAPAADITIRMLRWSSLAAMATGQIGRIAEDVVEGAVTLEGPMRALMAAAAHLLAGNPLEMDPPLWHRLVRRAQSTIAHTRTRDARQVRFHYDVSDDFYALWLDPLRVYSCAYYRNPGLTLAQAQESKLDHICRKLMLREGEHFLDMGAGWGGLLLWAAEHYGVKAHGITLSHNQHAYVQALIKRRGLQARVRVDLMDYRDLPGQQVYDKIASVGMFEHVGRCQMRLYLGTIARLLRPGGLVLNHGITSARTTPGDLGAGMGDFIDKYIFPGGELLHVGEVLHHMACAGLESLDVENLRPHYARTLWDWSDALECRLEEARHALQPHGDAADRTLRAYRLYLAGCAMAFERGWLALHQVLASRPDGQLASDTLPGAQSSYPFNRAYMYH